MTNGDRIRMMSDEELYDNYFYATDCADCDFNKKCSEFRTGGVELRNICKETWLKWLGEEEQ